MTNGYGSVSLRLRILLVCVGRFTCSLTRDDEGGMLDPVSFRLFVLTASMLSMVDSLLGDEDIGSPVAFSRNMDAPYMREQ